MEQMKAFAEDRLAKYVGVDMTTDANQIRFCSDFRKIVEYFYYQQNTVVINNGMVVVGVTFEAPIEGVPMIIHSEVFR